MSDIISHRFGRGRVNGIDRRAWARTVPFRSTVRLLLVASVSAALLWVVWIYSNGLRDARYLDGWVLAGGMGLQVWFHVAKKATGMSPKYAVRWRQFHIFVGYLLITAFVSHSNFSLPDTHFEWALWVCFVVIASSGLFTTYLGWSFRAAGPIDVAISPDRIATRRVELAEEIYAAVSARTTPPAALALPALPYDAWIMDLYTCHIKDFLQGPRNFAAHLVGSRRPLERLTGEIDNLSRYVDPPCQAKLAVIRRLVVEKDSLDLAGVHRRLTAGGQLVHVPVTYALVVLVVLHVLVVYAFSSGAW